MPLPLPPRHNNNPFIFLPWEPPADPDKPACPYRRSFTVDIENHTPPAPFGGRDYGRGERTGVDDQTLRTITQTDLVMGNPPPETPTPATQRIATLSITGELAVTDGRGAQLTICIIRPKVAGQCAFTAVAKIYDPLYYSFPNKDVPSVPSDVTRDADLDYSREAAAYEHLERIGEAGSFAPGYFGSWTFNMAIRIGDTAQQRPVRMILIESVSGPSILQLCLPNSGAALDRASRLEILARVLDGNARLLFKGINQNDLASRNVICAYPPSTPPAAMSQPPQRIVLIDYNAALVYERTKYGIRPWQRETLPPNPMELYWNHSLFEFGGWIPAEWEATPRLRQEWLRARFGGPNAARYAPVKTKLDFAELVYSSLLQVS
ncbi:hypothetical protein QBC40DRAFT_293803 [Triangularia verruculosa]|uniref:Protein kinase domain-containing protein n=1 Tax=Triangularia verruculosa TaxID=2587418 RepID=A0AAN7AW28_9PEZI|nr:hypothetical protein QBC40DRAFT_293803 [Triangularia verruculosa]